MERMTATITTDRAGLLAAIHDAPDDDAPRLIYADWLDEQPSESPCPDGSHRVGSLCRLAHCAKCGDTHRAPNHFAERAELIRVQCELARLPEKIPCICNRCGRTENRDQWSVQSRCFKCAGSLRRADGKKTAHGKRHPKNLLENRSRDLLAAHGERWAMDELVRPCGWMEDSGRQWRLVGTELRARGRHDSELWGAIYQWHWSRGFISTVELATEALMGRECERCTGSGFHPVPSWQYRNQPCPDCHGSGRVGGCVEALRATLLPITKVVLTDKRPLHNVPTIGGNGFRWINRDDRVHGSEELPLEIFNLLPTKSDCVFVRDRGEDWLSMFSIRDYDSEPAALTALAQAAAEYVRGATG